MHIEISAHAHRAHASPCKRITLCGGGAAAQSSPIERQLAARGGGSVHNAAREQKRRTTIAGPGAVCAEDIGNEREKERENYPRARVVMVMHHCIISRAASRDIPVWHMRACDDVAHEEATHILFITIELFTF